MLNFKKTGSAKLFNGVKDFMDMVSPSVLKFSTDHFVCENTYRSVWALRECPTATDEQAILRHLGDKDGVLNAPDRGTCFA
jgi:hypothetical protein